MTEAKVKFEPSASDYALTTHAVAEAPAPELPYLPPMPKDRSIGIALVGAGGISAAHLDAYRAYGLNVLLICSRDLGRARARRDAFFPKADATDDFEKALGNPRIKVVDFTTNPDVRAGLMRRAFAAGKHVLSQKPFVEDLTTGQALVEEAERLGIKLAVKQNGRWAPHLAYMREAVAAGLIGEVIGAHVAIRWNHGWIAGTAFEGVDNLLLWDFGIHWFDFLSSVIGERPLTVRAAAARAASQAVRPPMLAEVHIAFDGGHASLILNGAARYGACDMTAIIGTEGTVSSRGSDLGVQSVELHTAVGVARPALKGTWFNDGFAGTMGELLCAIEEGREPMNSARGNLASLRLCLAAVRASRTGETVSI
ncbi:MAG TPA: Gfo/Idh/MocA family oxidoreductase [Roseiarcus sp.]|jgi:predicted dehydrogenase|nr:Gfo/Idh/MocA family oxidoreductase [Roseiarcus sp.]